MSNSRIYIVTDGELKHLVEAATQAQALRHVVKSVFQVKVATAKEVADLIKKGASVQTASSEVEA